jgi:hypothetical protein
MIQSKYLSKRYKTIIGKRICVLIQRRERATAKQMPSQKVIIPFEK